MIDTSNLGLVLEGGGMRGVFTCGVLDYFMDNNINFPYVVGVSAGACNGLSYISKQRGRAKFSNIDLYKKYKYMGVKYLIKKKNYIDFDLLFYDFPERIIPYDYDACAQSETKFEMVTTNCLTGEPNYLEEKNDKKRIIDIAKASSSLPIICPISFVDNVPMLDGGIVDSIPIERAMHVGYAKNIVILTRNKGYRKERKDIKVPGFIYKKYPEARRVLGQRNSLYNYQLALIEKLEDEGAITVIRPLEPVVVDRVEKNIEKLEDLYHEGYKCAKNMFENDK